MNFNFGDVLGRTWKIGWNYKVLWLWQMLPGLFLVILTPYRFLSSPIFIINFIIPITLALASIFAQLAITYGALKVEKSVEKLSLREMFSESLPYFSRVLGLYFLFGSAGMLIWVGFIAIYFAGFMLTSGLTFIILVPLFLLLIAVFLAGYSILELSQAAVIANDMRTIDAIGHSWRLFRANATGVILLMAVLYFGMFILLSIFMLPMIFLFPLRMNSQGNFNNLLPVLSQLISLILLVVHGILMTFFQSAWAVTYLRLNNSTNTPIILEEKPVEAGI